MQAKLQNLVKRIQTCADQGLVFNQDVSDIMNRLTSSDVMASGEIQVIEANLDMVTDYDGNLLEVMTTPVGPANKDKVNNSFLNLFYNFAQASSSRNVVNIMVEH